MKKIRILILRFKLLFIDFCIYDLTRRLKINEKLEMKLEKRLKELGYIDKTEWRINMDKYKVYIETDIDYNEYEFDTLEEAEEFYDATDETAGIILPDGTLI